MFMLSMSLKDFAGIFGMLFFARRRFFLTKRELCSPFWLAGAACTSVECSSSHSVHFFFFFLRFPRAAFGAAVLVAPPLLFFHDALARLRDSLKLVLPLACTFFTCSNHVVIVCLPLFNYLCFFWFPHGRVLLLVLRIPRLPMRLGDQLEHVCAVRLPDFPELALHALCGLVIMPQGPHKVLVPHEMPRPRVPQTAYKLLCRAGVPHVFHAPVSRGDLFKRVT